MKLLLLLVLVGLAMGCEEEIKEKLELFAKGKDLKAMFHKYAPSGYMNSDQMDKFLTDADVSSWCRWPDLVIDSLDSDSDAKLSWEEVSSAFNKFKHEEL